MAQFESAVNFVLGNEGGLSEDANDPGGITNFGISFRFLQQVPADVLKRAKIFGEVTSDTIVELTKAQAIEIYRAEFWEARPFEKIMNQILANYIFDMCVNFGITQAIKLTQRAVWACQKAKDFLLDDGVLGPKTLGAINNCSFMLIPAMIAQRDCFYRLLVVRNPKLKDELDGWLNRAYRIYSTE